MSAQHKIPKEGVYYSFDWDVYKQYRPTYPKSLERLILNYHHDHSNSLRFAHDIGSGSGVYVPVLASYFDHVHASDPSAENIGKARAALSAYRAEHWQDATLSFSVSTGEASHLATTKGTVDLITVMCAAHWAESEKLIAAAAEQLAPNGTLCIVSYSTALKIINSPRASEAWQKAIGEFWKGCLVDISTKGLAFTIPTYHGGVDTYHLPGDKFILDVSRRLYLNCRGLGSKAFTVEYTDGMGSPGEKRVQPGETVIDYPQDAPESQGWTQTVDKDWFRPYIRCLVTTEDSTFDVPSWQEFERVVAEEFPHGGIEVSWPAAVLLATRK